MNTTNCKTMFTTEEIKAAKATRDVIIEENISELKSVYMAGEIVMWDELSNQETSLSGNSAGVWVHAEVEMPEVGKGIVCKVGKKGEPVPGYADDETHILVGGCYHAPIYVYWFKELEATPTNQSDAVGILKELVELKEMKDRLAKMETGVPQSEYDTLLKNFESRIFLAWEAARKYLQSLNQ